jgi:hypothetical protein
MKKNTKLTKRRNNKRNKKKSYKRGGSDSSVQIQQIQLNEFIDKIHQLDGDIYGGIQKVVGEMDIDELNRFFTHQ